MALMLQLIFTLFTLSSNTECSDVFVSVGDSVQLHTQEPVPQFRIFIWKFKTEYVLQYYNLPGYHRIEPSASYKDRVEFNNETYSLTLKNLQKTDNGPYEAIAARDKETVVAVYNLSVLVSSDMSVLIGKSVQLQIQPPVPEFRTFYWDFNGTKNILEYSKIFKQIILSTRYKGRVEFNNETYSLTLKNLQKTDSGLYEAKTVGDNKNIVATYTLSVLDPVEAPVLIYQLNKETFNITVSCRNHHLSINSSCDKETCEERKKTAVGGFALSLFVSNCVIICNHSNPVSWKMDVLEMEKLKLDCFNEDSVSPSAGVSVCLLKIVLFSTALILMVSAVITVHIRGRLRKSS
ncbi:SLAM family member 9-like [Hoplias malabaricus]|uniref:SLAM family member 9-like n=1 Tax=Hoplias malabaricus TaxID=27720 RepID=UPI003462CD04